MAERKPVLLAVDDDHEVVRAVERDLRNRYAPDFTVVAAGSGEEALEILGPLLEQRSRWLIVTDQRGRGMAGVGCSRSRQATPDVARATTAYADTEVAMRAIGGSASTNTDEAAARPKSACTRCSTTCRGLAAARRRSSISPKPACRGVIGHHFSTESLRARPARQQPDRPSLVEVDEEPAPLWRKASARHRFAAGGALPTEPPREPGSDRVAARVGLQTEEKLALYDVVVGAGQQSRRCRVRASEARTVVVERQSFGGQAGASWRIETSSASRRLGAGLARRATPGASVRRGAAHCTGGGRHRRRKHTGREASRREPTSHRTPCC